MNESMDDSLGRGEAGVLVQPTPPSTDRATGSRAGGEAAVLAAFDSAPMPLVGLSATPEPAILFVNRAFQELAGTPEDEIVGLDFWRGYWLAQAHEADTAELDRFKLDLAAGRPASIDFVSRRLGGPDTWSRLSVAPAADPHGTILCLVGSQVEIRPPLPGEADAEQLARRTGALAHEFNNLLQVVVGYVTIILGALDKPEMDHRRIRRGAEAIQAATARAATLIQTLSEMTRR